MKPSIQLLLAAVALMLASLKPDLAAFIPQWLKLGIAAVLLLLGLYKLWQEQQWRG